MTERDDVLTAKLRGFGTTIFAEMSALAAETGAINLGQGFPDTDGPGEVLDTAVAASIARLSWLQGYFQRAQAADVSRLVTAGPTDESLRHGDGTCRCLCRRLRLRGYQRRPPASSAPMKTLRQGQSREVPGLPAEGPPCL